MSPPPTLFSLLTKFGSSLSCLQLHLSRSCSALGHLICNLTLLTQLRASPVGILYFGFIDIVCFIYNLSLSQRLVVVPSTSLTLVLSSTSSLVPDLSLSFGLFHGFYLEFSSLLYSSSALVPLATLALVLSCVDSPHLLCKHLMLAPPYLLSKWFILASLALQTPHASPTLLALEMVHFSLVSFLAILYIP